jgi:hypothetical protein
MTTQLLLKGYGDHAKKGKNFQCRNDQKDSDGNKEKIRELKEIDKRRMDLAGYVDRAMLSRSQLLLQEKIIYFQDVTNDIIQKSMKSLAKKFEDQIEGLNMNSIFAPIPVKNRNMDLPGNVFSKITIEKAEKVMTKTVQEQY